MKNKNKSLKIIIILIIIGFTCLSLYIGSKIVTNLNNPEQFRLWIASFNLYGPLIYVLITILQILMPIIPGEPMEMVAGYAFGHLKGFLLCFFAEALGSVLVYFVVKRFGRKILDIFFDEDKINSLKFLQNTKKAKLLFTLLFVVPGTPKDLLCYFAGLTEYGTKFTLIVITIGRFLSIITSTTLGSFLSEKDYLFAIICLIIMILITACGFLYYHYVSKKENQKNK